MADRFLFKKFASETNDVGQFGSFQSTGGNIGDGVKTTDPDLIQSLPAWKAGWGNAVDNGLLLPRLEEMNGVQRVFAEMLWNQWRDGITFWQAGAPVKALQSIVMYQTGDEFPKLYINKTGVNGTNPPPQDTDNWKPLNDFFVTTDTAQTITGFKAFNNGSGNQRTSILVVTDDGVGEDANNKWAGSIQFKKGNMDVAFCEALKNSSNTAIAQLLAFNSVNGQNIFSWVRPVVESNGYAFATAPTPSAGATGEEITTAGWFNSKMQVVSALPANPDEHVFYFIPE